MKLSTLMLPLLLTAVMLGACKRTDRVDATHTTSGSVDTIQVHPNSGNLENAPMSARGNYEVGASPSDPAQENRDHDITMQVQAAIAHDTSLPSDARQITITTTNGDVVLRGSVGSDAERSALEAKARMIAGVKVVENDLDIDSKP